MENRVNVFPPETAMGYRERIRILRERKLEETQVKSKIKEYQDGDDYGSVPAPEDYRFQCVPTTITARGTGTRAGAGTFTS